jgi:hypothetical protein
MNMKLLANTILVVSTFGFAGISNASVYYLESNNLSLSGSLASVTLTDSGSNVDVTVTALLPGSEVLGLGFNLSGTHTSIGCNSLPTGDYSCNVGSFQYDGSGNYTDEAAPSKSNPPNRFSSFSFTLLGYNEADFIANTPEGNLFATHVYPANGAATGFAFGGTVVPVPAAVWLFGSGLLGLVAVSRRKSR